MKNKIKQDILKTLAVTMIAVMMLSNYAMGQQWTTNGANIYNNNSGNVGFSTTGNFTNPAYLIDAIGDINIDLSGANGSAYRLKGDRILWHNNTTTDIFVGKLAGNSTMSGHLNTLVGNGAGTALSSGNRNTMMGNAAGNKTTTGAQNVFIGDSAGYTNVSGNYLTCVGSMAGYKCTAYYNTFVGYQSGSAVTSGTSNCFVGYNAALSVTTGTQNTIIGANTAGSQTTASYNSAVGTLTLDATTTGARNSALGYGSGLNNTTGDSNVFVGYRAGGNITTGGYNTFVGYEADASSNNLLNATAIGNGAVVDASNKVRIGNSSVTVIEGNPAAYTSTSDARFKENVSEKDVHGLDFILKLRPVSYNFNRLKFAQYIKESIEGRERELQELSKTRSTGFLAQEVEKIVKETGYTSFDAVHAPTNENDNYSLAYSQFVVPLVKAVQELNAKLQTQDSTNQVLQNQLNTLQDVITSGQVASLSNNVDRNGVDITLSSQSIVLDQNQPNPFKEQTTITYFIPDDATDVKIIFTDAKGNVLREVEISQTGSGQLNVFAQDLSSGIYTYTLVADGVTIDTKKMVCTK